MESADCAVSAPNLVPIGEKRAAAADDDGVDRRKRMRKGDDDYDGGGGGGDVMRRVAEIVMVLSAMGRMRGGKEPTEVEKRMMAEAREKVVAICEGIKPRDFVSTEGVGGLIEDLGLGRLKDGRLGFQGPRLSVVERMHLGNRRMAEAKAKAAQAAAASHPTQRVQTATHPAQRVQTASAGIADNRGTPANFHVFPTKKPGTAMPAGHASPMTPAAMAYQSRANEIRPTMVSPGLANSSVSREFPSATPTRVYSVPHQQDGRLSGPFFTPHVPVVSSTEQHLARNISTPVQALSVPSPHTGTKTRAMDHAHNNSGQNLNTSALHMAPQNVQASKPAVAQTTPAVLPGVHHPLQGVPFAQSPSLFSRHAEISKVVQNLLYPKPPEPPSWTLPSREYMNRPVACQLCKNAMSEVDGVLVCDICERGYHMRCLQSLNKKVVPRGDWHCHRCLSISNGKPFPPKYGRVTRNSTPASAPSNATSVQSSSEKVETADQDLSPPNLISGSSGKENSSNTGATAESVSVLKLPEGAVKKDDKQDSERCSNVSVVMGPFESPPSETSADKPSQPVVKSEPVAISEGCGNDPAGMKGTTSVSTSNAPPSNEPLETLLKSQSLPHENPHVALVKSDASVKSLPPSTISDQVQGSSNDNVIGQQLVSRGDEVLRGEQDNSDEVLRPLEKSDVIETNDSTSSHDPNTNHQDPSQEVPVEMSKVGGQLEPSLHPEHMKLDAPLVSEDRLLVVDWIGDISSTADENKFYQSCSISGVVYQVQDYALVQLDNGKLVPSKLQAMWEDGQTRSKWVSVTRCYFPADLPESVGHPCAPESNEVYESNHEMTLMASSIRGPCEVKSSCEFGGDSSNHGTQVKAGTYPVFACKWFFDMIKGVFRPIPS